MKTSQKDYSMLRLDLSHTMKGKSFKSFAELRKDASEYIRAYRDQFVRVVLNGVGVSLNEGATRRERVETLEKHGIEINDDESNNCVNIYKRGVLLATWNNEFELRFSEKGKLICNITYQLHSKEVTE